MSDSEGLKSIEGDDETWLLVSRLGGGKDEFDGPAGDDEATEASSNDDEIVIGGLLEDDAPKANAEEEEEEDDDVPDGACGIGALDFFIFAKCWEWVLECKGYEKKAKMAEKDGRS